MKIFTLLHKSTDKGTINIGRKSRIPSGMVREWFGNTSQTLHFTRLAACAAFLLFMGVGNAWGADPTTTLALCGSTKDNRTVTDNGITFKISGGDVKGGIAADYHYLKNDGDVAYLTWSVPTGYTIAVSKVTLEAKRYWEGYGYYYSTKKKSPEVLFLNNSNSWTNYSLDNSSYFSLNNSDTLFIKKTKTEIDYKNITFTYTKTANTYTIVFNGNGATSGSTASVGATYDQNVTLAANGYRKHQYKVSYNTAGGSVVSPDSTLYTFLGWNKKADGTGDNYSAGTTYTKPNFTSTQGATYTLYAKWSATPANTTVTLPTPTKDGYSFEGWYNGETRIGAGGVVYTPTADVTLTAHWSSKYTPRFTVKDTVMMVDGVQANAFSLEHVPSPYATYKVESISEVQNGSYSGKVVEYDGATNTMYARNAGVVKVVIKQAETAEVHEGKSDTVIYRVYKYGSNVTGVSNLAANVDANVSSSYSWTYTKPNANAIGAANHAAGTPIFGESATNFYYTLSHDVRTSVTSGSPDGSVVIAYNASTKTATGKNKGVCTVHLYQPETYKYAAADRSFDVTISKIATSFSGSAYNLMVDGTQTANYSYTNTSAAQPTDDSDDDFYYAVEDISYTNSAKNKKYNSLDSLVRFNPDNKQITALNAGTGKITFYQAETYKYTGDTLELNVTVSKHDPVFTWHAPEHYYYNSTVANIFTTTGTNDTTVRSDNPAVRVVANTLYISPTFDETHITLTQAENYYWNYKEEIVTFTPEKQENHLPITSLTETNASTYSVSMSGKAKWETKGGKSVMTFGDGTWYGTRPEGYAVFTFTGIPDTLKFTTSCSDVAWQYPVKEDYMFEVYESPDNSSWSLRWQCDNTNGYKDSDNKNANRSLSLSPTTRYIKLRYHGACWGHFSDIQVTEKYQFVANEGEKIFDFGSKGAKYGLQEERLIFDHANAGSMTRAELISGADAAKFTVSPTTITGTGRDKSGSFVLSVSFDNDDDTGREDSDYTAKLRIYDNRGNADTVTLKGHRWGLTAPEFTWNQHHMPYYHNTTISNVVISTNTDYEKCPFTYESTDDDIAYVDEAGTLHIGEKSGSVTITVSQKEGNNYSELEKTFTFTPLVAPSLKVPFYLDSTIYTSGSVAIADGTTGAWDSESANDIRLGDGNVSPSSWGTKVFVIAFSDAPDKVSFRYKTNSTKTSRGWNRLLDLLGAPMWTIEESATGGTWDTVWNETSNSDFWKYETVQLSPRTQYVRFTYNGNGYGYFGNIQVTALDGYHFMRTKDGKYLSRGGKYGTQAVLDEIGVAVRVTRYTLDNVHDTTLVQFVDSREYLFEDLDGEIDEVYTDNGSRTSMKWKQIRNADTLIVQSMNGTGKYITLVGDTLKMTEDSAKATKWIPESATVRYNKVSTKLGTLAASAASCEFGAGENTLESVRRQISQNDYDKIDIPIPHLNDKVYEANVSGEGREAAGMWKVYSDTIGGLIPGFYRLTVQAMYQTGADPNDWENNQLGVESQIAYVYANDGFYPVKSRYDIDGRNYGAYETGTSISKDALMYYPDDATAAGEAFATASKYVNDVYAYVGEDSTLIYGIKNPSYVSGERLFYKNFTLTRICRKEYIYKVTADEEWNKLSNWEYKGDTPDAVPTINHKVTIQSDIIIEGELAAYSLTIDPDVKVTIAPTGGLTVGVGGISGATIDNFVIKASTAGQNGYVRVSPDFDGEMPNATVEYYCTSYYDQTKSGDNAATYQCVGAPITASGVRARDVYPAGTYLYTWNEATGAWVSSRAKLTFTPFQGFETTQRLNADGWQADYEGQLVSGRDVWNIDLSYTEGEGYNLLANSFAAPIAIENFDEDDFVNADQLIYILNAGTKKESHDNKGGEYDAPGKWLGIPINTAAELAKDGYPCMIPSMQGFWIKTTGASAQLKLDYSRLVWGVNYSGISENKPLRTPKRAIRNEESSITGRLKVNLLSENENDFVYLLESERYSSTYENGYDARKMYSGDVNIFTIAEDEELSVDATNSIIGTRVGVRTGEETAYTLEFSRVSTENELALRDNETNEEIDIYEGLQYTFFAEPNATLTERFEIVEREAPSITTGVDNADTKVKVHKFIKDNQVFILKNGVLYNTMGAIVR